VCLVSTISSSRNEDGAPILTLQRVLNVCVRALRVLARVTHRVRIASTVPDLALGTAVAVCPSTARAICSASSRSDLPSIRQAARLGWSTSITASFFEARK